MSGEISPAKWWATMSPQQRPGRYVFVTLANRPGEAEVLNSAPAAVGLTAAVSTVLAEANISCDVVAGYPHDHLVVPIERLDDAINHLRTLTD